MFTKEVLEKVEVMEKERDKMTSSLSEEKVSHTTLSGIEIKPAYSPKDLAGTNFEDIGIPGNYPYTRGNYPLHYQVEPVVMMPLHGYGAADDTAERREWLKKLGCSSHVGKEEEVMSSVIALDQLGHYGRDPDEPEARGRVGEGGMSVSTPNDFAPIFDGIPLDKTLTLFITGGATLPVTALYAAYVLDIRKESLKEAYHCPVNLPYYGWWMDMAHFPPRIAMRLMTELAKWYIENCPKSYAMQFAGYNTGEEGATTVQEAAFNMANVIEFMKECISVGLDPDTVAAKIWVHTHLSINFFEEIAKIRALRRVWAKTMKEKFGCHSREALNFRIYLAQTAGTDLTAQEPINNIIRITMMSLAGLLSDVEGLAVASYDEAVGIPTEEAVQVCMRTYQILAEETDVTHVTDPLGGSYFIESLTNRIEEEIFKLLKKMADIGGYMKCWETGWIRGQIQQSAYDKIKKINNGEVVRVGVNKYRIEDIPKIKAFRRKLESEEKAIKRCMEYKQNRDQQKIDKCLAKVKDACVKIDKEWPSSCGLLMASLVDAARSGATLGEMHRMMREVFGYGYYSG